MKDSILSIPITQVIEKYIQKLKKKGSNYEACCPFHNEKTPSFTVFPRKNNFKCFGCGKQGNAIDFVMEYKKLDYKEAVKQLCQDHGIEYKWDKLTAEEKKIHDHKAQLMQVNILVSDWFAQQLQENPKALQYARDRWSDDVIKSEKIGYNPDNWQALYDWSKTQNIKTELLIEIGVLSEKNNRIFDFLKGRLVFPVKDKMGIPRAFTGRVIPSDEKKKEGVKEGETKIAKYMNTKESVIYKKGELLYGINNAYHAMKQERVCYLVEGNPDVIALQSKGILNTVAAMGTSLTKQHVKEIKKYCDSVVIIGDTDTAGENAVHRSALMLLEENIIPNVLYLPKPDDGSKHDADSFFESKDHFWKYHDENVQDYIISVAKKNAEKANNPNIKMKVIADCCKLIAQLNQNTHELYVDQISKFLKPKKAIQDELKAILNEKVEEKEEKVTLPSHVNPSDFEKFGFYEENNCYKFNGKNGCYRGSNFTMVPLFHIESTINAKRLYKITNEYGYQKTIELAQKDLISISAFKLRIESLGNFLWEAGDIELGKLKRYLYEKTESCIEVTQLGWQKDYKIWAWSNGTFDKEFNKIDINGIVRQEAVNFYLPAFSKIYENEPNLFSFERKFKHTNGTISFYDYSQKLINVFGDNASFALCFYIGTLFRDVIFKKLNSFPILNLFGPKGAGKTELAVSLLQFFGHISKGPNINNTSMPALGDHVGAVANALVHIDEYKNNLEFNRIEYLKGLWDGMGRTKKDMDRDKKNTTTAVDAGIMLTGQEMPTADIALYSRLLFLAFTQTEFSDKDKADFLELKEIEQKGLTHITNEILKLREDFVKGYNEAYDRTIERVQEELGGAVIEDRILKNWCCCIAAFLTIENKINVPFTSEELFKKGAALIKRQNKETKSSNEISIFWSIIEYLVADKQLNNTVDFKIEMVNSLKTDKVDCEWKEDKKVLFLRHTRAFQKYQEHGQRVKENILPTRTLEYYLRNHPAFLGKKDSVHFKINEFEIDNTTSKNRTVTTAYAFDYKMLEIDIEKTSVYETEQPKAEKQERIDFNKKEEGDERLKGW